MNSPRPYFQLRFQTNPYYQDQVPFDINIIKY